MLLPRLRTSFFLLSLFFFFLLIALTTLLSYIRTTDHSVRLGESTLISGSVPISSLHIRLKRTNSVHYLLLADKALKILWKSRIHVRLAKKEGRGNVQKKEKKVN